MVLLLLAVWARSSIVPNHCDSLPLRPCVALWPSGAVPNETDVPTIFPNETRKNDDGHGCGADRSELCDHINDVSVPSITPFIVRNGTGAAVIIAPGGGYHNLAWTKEGIDLARMYNQLGVSAFVLKYRVPARPDLPGLPKWWAPLQDAQRAVSLVRASAATYGVNASRIGFTGLSAGGHLAAHLSTTYATRAYAHIDGADNVSCRPDFSIFLYPWMLLPNNKVPAWGAAYSLASELDGMSKGHPPSLFVHNLDDPSAPPQGTLAYAQKLLALGAPKPVVHAYNKGGHGFALCQGDTEWLEVCDWPKVAQRFLQDHSLGPGWPAQPADAEPAQQLKQGC